MTDSIANIYLRSGQVVSIRFAGLIKVNWSKKTGEIESWSIDGAQDLTVAAIPPQSISAIVAVPVRESSVLPEEGK